MTLEDTPYLDYKPEGPRPLPVLENVFAKSQGQAFQRNERQKMCGSEVDINGIRCHKLATESDNWPSAESNSKPSVESYQ